MAVLSWLGFANTQACGKQQQGQNPGEAFVLNVSTCFVFALFQDRQQECALSLNPSLLGTISVFRAAKGRQTDSPLATHRGTSSTPRHGKSRVSLLPTLSHTHPPVLFPTRGGPRRRPNANTGSQTSANVKSLDDVQVG